MKHHLWVIGFVGLMLCAGIAPSLDLPPSALSFAIAVLVVALLAVLVSRTWTLTRVHAHLRLELPLPRQPRSEPPASFPVAPGSPGTVRSRAPGLLSVAFA